MENLLLFILSIAGTIILMCFAVIGFFLKILHNDVRRNTEECGRNKGRIELVELESNSEIAKLTALTQLEIKTLSTNVNTMTNKIDNLIEILIKDSKK